MAATAAAAADIPFRAARGAEGAAGAGQHCGRWTYDGLVEHWLHGHPRVREAPSADIPRQDGPPAQYNVSVLQ